jgi:hypothetical protein
MASDTKEVKAAGKGVAEFPGPPYYKTGQGDKQKNKGKAAEKGKKSKGNNKKNR